MLSHCAETFCVAIFLFVSGVNGCFPSSDRFGYSEPGIPRAGEPVQCVTNTFNYFFKIRDTHCTAHRFCVAALNELGELQLGCDNQFAGYRPMGPGCHDLGVATIPPHRHWWSCECYGALCNQRWRSCMDTCYNPGGNLPTPFPFPGESEEIVPLFPTPRIPTKLPRIPVITEGKIPVEIPEIPTGIPIEIPVVTAEIPTEIVPKIPTIAPIDIPTVPKIPTEIPIKIPAVTVEIPKVIAPEITTIAPIEIPTVPEIPTEIPTEIPIKIPAVTVEIPTVIPVIPETPKSSYSASPYRPYSNPTKIPVVPETPRSSYSAGSYGPYRPY